MAAPGNQMDRDFYAALPDSMDSAQIEPHFRELLQTAESTNPPDIESIAGALYELADRQWHSYEPLSAELLDLVDDWIVRNWESSSREFVSAVIGVIGMLGLPRSWSVLKSSVDSDLPVEVRVKVEAAIAEFERDDPADPWSGMPKRN